MTLDLILHERGQTWECVKRSLDTGEESNLTDEDVKLLLAQEEERKKAEEHRRRLHGMGLR